MKRCEVFTIPLIAIIIASVNLSPGFSIAQNQNPPNPTDNQQTPPTSQRQRAKTNPAHNFKASKLMGYTVESQTGEKLGTVKDMAIDAKSGRLEFVLIATGGFAGVGAQLKAVPPTALSPATAKEKTLAMKISPDRWKSAPNFSKEQIANIGNPMQMRQIYRYYGQTWPALAQAPAGGGPPMPPTGRETGNAEKLRLASDLIDKSVVNQQGQDMGRITDLLVNFDNPGVILAVLNPGSFVTSKNESAKNQRFAVPVYAFLPGPSDKNLLLDVNPGEFEQARPLSADSWKMAKPGAGPPPIFRYQENATENAKGIAPDTTAQNDNNNNIKSLTSSWKS